MLGQKLLNSVFVFSFALLISSCGGENVGAGSSPSTPPENPPVEAKATLALFGAPHCSNCKESFPQIQALLDQMPADRAKSLYVVMYVTESKPNERPTPEVAESYRAYLQLKAPAFVDEWRWKKFREYVGGSLQLPGAAILDANGKVLHSFRAGSTTFIPSEIVKAAEEASK